MKIVYIKILDKMRSNKVIFRIEEIQVITGLLERVIRRLKL